MATLPPGDYTVAVRDANNAAGIAPVEVYDLSSPLTTNFANFYVGGFVGTGDDVLIGGTTVRGTATEQVLFRTLGSDLGKSGIANSLANPALEVWDTNGVLLAVVRGAAGSTGVAQLETKELR